MFKTSFPSVSLDAEDEDATTAFLCGMRDQRPQTFFKSRGVNEEEKL